MEVFDAHTRFFGRDFYEFQSSRQPNGTSEIRLKRTEADGVDVPSDDARAYRDRLLAGMDSCGVSRAVTYAAVSQEMSAVAEAGLGSAGRLVPFATINAPVAESVESLKLLQPRYHFRGMILFPSLHDYNIGGTDASQALDFAADHNMVVFVHNGGTRGEAMELLGMNRADAPGRGTVNELLPVATVRNHLCFVVPHFGLGSLDELLELGATCRNVYVDTAGAGAWTAKCEAPVSLTNLLREERRVFGAERMLFGSNSGGFSGEYRKDVLDGTIAAMLDAGIAPRDRAAILGGNLSRLLKA